MSVEEKIQAARMKREQAKEVEASVAAIVENEPDDLFDDPINVNALTLHDPINVNAQAVYDPSLGVVSDEEADALDIGDPAYGAFPLFVLAQSTVQAKHLGDTTNVTANTGSAIKVALEDINRYIVLGINFNNNKKLESDFARLYPDLQPVYYSEPLPKNERGTGWEREEPLSKYLESRTGIPMEEYKAVLDEAAEALPGSEVQINNYLSVKAIVNHITGTVSEADLKKYVGSEIKIQIPGTGITPFHLAYSQTLRRLSLNPIDKASIKKGWIPRAEFTFAIGELKTNKKGQSYVPWVISVADRYNEAVLSNTLSSYVYLR